MLLDVLDPTAVAGADREFLYTPNFGPQYPSTHTTLRLILTLDGDTLVASSRAEDGAFSGPTANAYDNSASDSGAVFVFR